MATTIYSEQFLAEDWWFFTRTSREYSEATGKLYRYPYPKVNAVQRQYLNKVWDSVAGGWVFWLTENPDPSGGYYRGPGVYGVDTSNYHEECIVHGRVQL